MKNYYLAFLHFVPTALIPVLLMLFLAGGATASAQVVTNTANSGPGTLRSAITNADNGAVITFDPSLSGATITLSNTLTINTNLTIDASALAGGLQINGNHAVTVFTVAPGTTNVLNSLTITNGYNSGSGGGIYNEGTLTLTNCTLSGNSAEDGGGIANNASCTVIRCTFSNNSTPSDGGGIDNSGGGDNGTLMLTNCTLSGNSAEDGGGIYNDGLLTLNQCTVSGSIATWGGGIYNSAGTPALNQCILSGNSAEFGGGIYNLDGPLALNQCTLSGNGAEYGGGIYNFDGPFVLNQCTLSGNSAFNSGGGGIYNLEGTMVLNQCTLLGNSAYNSGGGGIFNDGALTLNQCTLSGNSAKADGGGIDNFAGSATLMMTNTIVGGNSGSPGADIYNSATLTYGGSNLVQSVDNSGGTITGPAPLTSTPDLALLGNYGGPTQTMPPLPGSPAFGAGSVAANTFATDQRGYSRTQNGLIDLGAVELQSPAANPPVLENITVPAGGGAKGLQFTFTNAPAADFTVLTATNVSLALTNWTVLGEVQQVAPGQYQFTDPQAATNLVRFYRVRSP
jgi:hypothetical protein